MYRKKKKIESYNRIRTHDKKKKCIGRWKTMWEDKGKMNKKYASEEDKKM